MYLIFMYLKHEFSLVMLVSLCTCRVNQLFLSCDLRNDFVSASALQTQTHACTLKPCLSAETPSYTCPYMPVPRMYWADAASMEPVQARYWQLIACLQGPSYTLCQRLLQPDKHDVLCQQWAGTGPVFNSIIASSA